MYSKYYLKRLKSLLFSQVTCCLILLSLFQVFTKNNTNERSLLENSYQNPIVEPNQNESKKFLN